MIDILSAMVNIIDGISRWYVCVELHGSYQLRFLPPTSRTQNKGAGSGHLRVDENENAIVWGETKARDSGYRRRQTLYWKPSHLCMRMADPKILEPGQPSTFLNTRRVVSGNSLAAFRRPSGRPARINMFDRECVSWQARTDTKEWDIWTTVSFASTTWSQIAISGNKTLPRSSNTDRSRSDVV